MSKHTDLYRYFDQSGRLLYVGISLSAVARASQHKVTAHWWGRVARMERQSFPSRAAARAAEKAAIAAEMPVENVQDKVPAATKPQRVNPSSSIPPWFPIPKIPPQSAIEFWHQHFPIMVRITEFADALGVERRLVERLASEGVLPCFRWSTDRGPKVFPRDNARAWTRLWLEQAGCIFQEVPSKKARRCPALPS